MITYVGMNKLHNVKGKIKYITDEKRQENVLNFYSTTKDEDFWSKLADENQRKFVDSSSSHDKNNKCIEARELIIAIPNSFADEPEFLAMTLAENFKVSFGVECCCAVHFNQKGENHKADNLHVHLIFSERVQLEKPEVIEEQRAKRNYYYNEKGKQCKKSEAVKTLAKGTLIQQAATNYFGEKKVLFKQRHFLEEYSQCISKYFGTELFDHSRYFAQKHIGKYNPKAQYIQEYNNVVININNEFDQMEATAPNLFKEITPKQLFKEQMKESKIQKLDTDTLLQHFFDFQTNFQNMTPEQFTKHYKLDNQEDVFQVDDEEEL